MTVTPIRSLMIAPLLLVLAGCGDADPPRPVTTSPNSPAFSATPSGTGRSAALDPFGLRGLSAAAVTERLGTPNLRRRDPPAELWQYYGQGCVLDLFFYPEKDGLQVSYSDLRRRSGDVADPHCLERLTPAAGTAASGAAGGK